jgi:hypothetical protein
VRVIKDCEHGIVRQVTLLDDTGHEVVPVTRFLSHLTDSNYSPNTVCAYAYDLRQPSTATSHPPSRTAHLRDNRSSDCRTPLAEDPAQLHLRPLH